MGLWAGWAKSKSPSGTAYCDHWSAMEAFHLCEANAKGFAFLAHFTYNYTAKENTTLESARPSTQIQWELSDDLEEYMHFRGEVLGCLNDNVPSSIPFHTVSDSGYISLLIRESIDTGTTTADLRYTAFGIRQREYDELWRSPDTIDNRIMQDDVSLLSFNSSLVEFGMPREHWILLPDTGVPITSEGSSTDRLSLTTSNLQRLTQDYVGIAPRLYSRDRTLVLASLIELQCACTCLTTTLNNMNAVHSVHQITDQNGKREHRSPGRSPPPEPAANAIDITNAF
jgi:hypothetical protein